MSHRKSLPEVAPNPHPVCVVRWVLQTGRASIACEVEMNQDKSFDLRITPSWQRTASFVERFTNAVPAMKKHAQITASLRDLGWEVTDRTVDLEAAA
jgi:hypothetical protein